jgi:hypothetical protein
MKTPKSNSRRREIRNKPLDKNKIQQYMINPQTQSQSHSSSSSSINQRQQEVITKIQNANTSNEERWKLLMENIFMLSNSTSEIKKTLVEHDNRLNDHDTRINDLEENDDNNVRLLNELEQANLNKILEINGFVLTAEQIKDVEKLRQFVVDYLKEIGCIFNESNITSVHSYKRMNNNNEVDIIRVKFLDDNHKTALMRQKKNTPPIYFSHVLTKTNIQALKEAKNKVRNGIIKDAWASNGRIFIRLREGEKQIKIHDKYHLEAVMLKNTQSHGSHSQNFANIQHNFDLAMEHNGASQVPMYNQHQNQFTSLIPSNIRLSPSPVINNNNNVVPSQMPSSSLIDSNAATL